MNLKIGDPKALQVKSVLLNGVDVKGEAYEADDDQGYVLVYKRGEDGQFMTHRDNRGELGVVRELRSGTVEIIF